MTVARPAQALWHAHHRKVYKASHNVFNGPKTHVIAVITRQWWGDQPADRVRNIQSGRAVRNGEIPSHCIATQGGLGHFLLHNSAAGRAGLQFVRRRLRRCAPRSGAWRGDAARGPATDCHEFRWRCNPRLDTGLYRCLNGCLTRMSGVHANPQRTAVPGTLPGDHPFRHKASVSGLAKPGGDNCWCSVG